MESGAGSVFARTKYRHPVIGTLYADSCHGTRLSEHADAGTARDTHTRHRFLCRDIMTAERVQSAMDAHHGISRGIMNCRM